MLLDQPLLLIAGLGILAMVVGHAARHVVPDIVVFLAVGVAIGPEGLGLINKGNVGSLELLTDVALGAIIFLIGERLRLSDLRGMRRTLLPVTAGQILLTGGLVFLAARWAGAHFRLAGLLALIAAETGVLTVTATVAALRAGGKFTDHLLSGVALTNVVTAALFGLGFPLLLAGAGPSESTGDTLRVFAGMVVASGLVGLAGGWALRRAAALRGSGEQLLAVLLGVTAMVGAVRAVDGSVVVACLTAGLLLANTAPLAARELFDAIRVLQAPLYLIFFVVAGAEVHFEDLSRFGMVGLAYVVARTAGKVGGAALGSAIGGEGLREGARAGAALLPHAGMAIALVAAVVEHTYTLGDDVSGVVLGSIVLFELAGPVLVRWSIRSAGEAGRAVDPAVAGLLGAANGSAFRRALLPAGNAEVLSPRLPGLLDAVSGLGADLVVVHVAPSAQRTAAGEELLAEVRRAAQEAGVDCVTECRVGESVSDVLARAARDYAVDLVIMGQPTPRDRDQATHGGITRRVLDTLDVPVLIYPVDPGNPG